MGAQFRGIAGLRAWLAWIVAAAGLVHLAGLEHGAAAHALTFAADQAIMLFMVITGFVITHRVLMRAEAWPVFVVRRALRIYPVYIVCLGAATWAAPAYFDTIAAQPWGALSPAADTFAGDIVTFHADRWTHLAAEITLLQGLIPDALLFHAASVPLAPAWTLSAVWQFCLVAPFVVAAARNRRQAAMLSAVALALFALWERGWLGSYGLPAHVPSSLAGAGPLFAAGLATRLVLPQLATPRHFPLALALWSVVLAALLLPHALFGAGWLVLVGYAAPAARPQGRVPRVLAVLLDSEPARWLGARAYAVFLVHYPLIQALVAACAGAGLAYWPMVTVLVLAAPPLTLAAAVLLHALVERPAVALGRHLKAPLLIAQMAPLPAE